MKVLELFAGTCSFSNVAKEMGCAVFTSDFDTQFNTDYPCDIMDFDIQKLPWKPDVIWASPPCTTFSVASIGKHWNKDHTPKTKEAEQGLLILKKTIEIIKELKPDYWFIENPRGKMRKVIEPPQNAFRKTVTYCQYGDKRMKPTDIWTNCFEWVPRPICKNGDPCHEKAPRGSKTGTQGIDGAKDRSRVPEELCEEILKLVLVLDKE